MILDFKKIISLIFSLIYASTAISQVKMNVHEHKKVPEQYQFKVIDIKPFMSNKYVKLEEYLPNFYVKNASEDYTDVIQKVLDENRNVQFPSFPLLINEKGLSVKSNSNLYFGDNSQLILKPNSLDRYEILRLHNVHNIKILNAVIIGDKELHKSSKGEWGMGIAIRGASSNIQIYNARISDCWGDGIYIGHLRKIAPKDIIIANAVINNMYRNGISITTGENINISNTVISNINYNGIKIEPSNAEATFKKIVLKNINTFNNYGSGVSVGGLSKLIGQPDANLELEIINSKDDGSQNGMFFGLVSVRNKSKYPVKGCIKIVNPEWTNNKESTFTKRKFYQNVPNIEFIRLKNIYKNDIETRHKKDKEISYL